ncbi:MAG: helicase HerA domain-containing protein, partial [Candidatus Thorarchaeota archaeon]
MSEPTLYLTDEVDQPSERILQKFWTLIRVIWIISSILCAIYLSIAYLLPIAGLLAAPQFPLKIAIEAAICLIPVLTAVLLTGKKVLTEKMEIWIDGENLFLQMGRYIIATSCFEISSVHASSVTSFNAQPKYNTAMLLAMRAGMSDDLTVAYEVGISQEKPFLRVFITARGNSVIELKEILKREATRTEAILLSSLDGAEMRLLNGVELESVIVSFLRDSLHDDYIEKDHALLVLDGIPHVAPSEGSSQIGSFLSTVLRQGYSASFTCVFSSVNPKKERKKLEREWRNIREKEKRKDDSLADQAAKKRLVDQYEEVQGDTGWFEVTSYLIVKSKDVNRIKDALRGLALSIWGGDGFLSLKESRLRGRTYLRLLTRRHLKSQRMHVSKLAAYVNMPAQQIPVITSMSVPSFPVPSSEIVDNELVIGNTVFGGRSLSNVGLKVEWLREHVAILGATGTGKTTLVKHLMAELSRKTDAPWWIFDVKGSEYRD